MYEYTKSLPFWGRITGNVSSLTADEWIVFILTYEVGGSGLADGVWIKATFKILFPKCSTSFSSLLADPEKGLGLITIFRPHSRQHVSAKYIPDELHLGENPATLQSLSTRFDQKWHERPFQKAIIVDIVDGYINPGDKIVIHLGDRRFGVRGTREQTFGEDSFLMRWYIGPVGVSRFAAIKPDIVIDIHPGPPAKLKVNTPRLVQLGARFPISMHADGRWGNAATNMRGARVL